jgi:tripartite-type tricarboxylate transporter receptor subunit TctC
MRARLKFSLLALAAIAAMNAAPGLMSAQDAYPGKTIMLVVPVPPGGAADFIARTLGQKLSEAMGQSVVISNRGGASGTIAADNVAKAAPDGHTLLLNSITTHGIGPHLYLSLPYDPVNDFTPIALAAKLPLIMTVSAGLPMRSVAEVVAYGKENPGKLTFASSGNGGAPHLAGELFSNIAGITMLHAPYRGSGPAVIDVGAGRVDIMFDAVPSLLSLIQAGKLRPLAAASAARNPTLPDIPTFSELGMPGLEVSLWYGIVGPAALPPPVVGRLNAELGKIMRMPDVQAGFAQQGAIPGGGTPDEFAAFMRQESARWREVVRKNDIKLQ